jgi:hypothetical protein
MKRLWWNRSFQAKEKLPVSACSRADPIFGIQDRSFDPGSLYALRKLETRFGEQLVSEIQTEDIREWLSGLPLATKTRKKHRGYAGQVFNLAVDYGYLKANPVSGDCYPGRCAKYLGDSTGKRLR